jgi:predicted nucleotide-binding protein (sugar kinase/HSP70/actin superfamily)
MNFSIYRDAAICFVMGDLLQRLVLRCRPYEVVKDSANDLCLSLMDEGYFYSIYMNVRMHI